MFKRESPYFSLFLFLTFSFSLSLSYELFDRARRSKASLLKSRLLSTLTLALCRQLVVFVSNTHSLPSLTFSSCVFLSLSPSLPSSSHQSHNCGYVYFYTTIECACTTMYKTDLNVSERRREKTKLTVVVVGGKISLFFSYPLSYYDDFN